MRTHCLLILLAILSAVLLACGEDEYVKEWCDATIACEVEDCACTTDEDCVIERCGWVPVEWPRPEDHECNWCGGCLNGHPIPRTVYAELEERWQDSCGNWLCTAHCDDDGDCCFFCDYAAHCMAGVCVGVLAERRPAMCH